MQSRSRKKCVFLGYGPDGDIGYRLCLSVLRVPESVSDLAFTTLTKENTLPGSWFEFSVVVFQYEGIRLTSENPQFVIIRLTIGP